MTTRSSERIPWGEIYRAGVAGYELGEMWGYLWGTYVMREHLEPVATLIRAAGESSRECSIGSTPCPRSAATRGCRGTQGERSPEVP